MSYKKKPPAPPEPAKVLRMPQPSGPSPDHPLFGAWCAKCEVFCYEMVQDIQSLNLKKGSHLYCSEAKPNQGDLVVIALPHGPTLGRCGAYDGFRICIERGQCQEMFTPSA